MCRDRPSDDVCLCARVRTRACAQTLAWGPSPFIKFTSKRHAFDCVHGCMVKHSGAPSLPAVKALRDWTPNHLVRIYEQPCNMGASLARNSGMAQSFGDWTVLLDDDVVPDEYILDAYLGAVLRYPKAKILVGLTRLPEPETWMQHALVSGRGWTSCMYQPRSAAVAGLLQQLLAEI